MKKLTALLACALLSFSLFAACNKDGAGDAGTADVKTADIWTAIETAVGADNLPMLGELDDTTLKDMYGIDAADLEDYTGRYAMINVQADEFLIAKVKDGKMDAVKEGIEKRKGDLDNTWKQYLPDVYEQVKNAKTEENGNYILFAVSANADKAVTAFQDTTKAK